MAVSDNSTRYAKSGIRELDQILGGGYTSGQMHLIEGPPGTGKTTLGLRFLLQGVCTGESVLYITFSETAKELSVVAASHGWSLDGIEFHELVHTDEFLQPEEQYTMFQPPEVELNATTMGILEQVENAMIC